MFRVLAAALTLTCLTAGAARAQDDEAAQQEEDYSRSGWYLGLYGVAAIPAYRDTGPLDFDSSGGGNIRLGYRNNELLALELEVEGIAAPARNGFDSHTLVGGLNAKLYPLGGRYQPYGIIGANGMSVSVESGGAEATAIDWGFRFGLGVDVYATPHIVLGIEGSYVFGVGDVWELDYGSIGLGAQYRF